MVHNKDRFHQGESTERTESTGSPNLRCPHSFGSSIYIFTEYFSHQSILRYSLLIPYRHSTAQTFFRTPCEGSEHDGSIPPSHISDDSTFPFVLAQHNFQPGNASLRQLLLKVKLTTQGIASLKAAESQFRNCEPTSASILHANFYSSSSEGPHQRRTATSPTAAATFPQA